MNNSSLVRNTTLFAAGLLGTGAGIYLAYSRRRRQTFAGKIVVITGGSRGLGLAMAEEFGRRGARLVLVARDREELNRAADHLLCNDAVRNPQDVLTIIADLCKEHEAERAIALATRQFGRVDVLVNNAGVITVGPLENQTAADFRKVMETNFYSGLYCTLAVLPQMLKRRAGAIANITSIGGKIAVPHLLPYTASKFAFVGFSEGLAAELGSKGVRVTTVVPGLMRTGSHRNALFSGDASREYRWFSLSANLPGISIAARSAARQIINGVAAGATEVAITPQAFVASRFGHLLPELMRIFMQAANLLLPSPRPGQTGMHPGHQVRDREPLPARIIGNHAARRYNQMSA